MLPASIQESTYQKRTRIGPGQKNWKFTDRTERKQIENVRPWVVGPRVKWAENQIAIMLRLRPALRKLNCVSCEIAILLSKLNCDCEKLRNRNCEKLRKIVTFSF